MGRGENERRNSVSKWWYGVDSSQAGERFRSPGRSRPGLHQSVVGGEKGIETGIEKEGKEAEKVGKPKGSGVVFYPGVNLFHVVMVYHCCIGVKWWSWLTARNAVIILLPYSFFFFLFESFNGCSFSFPTE